MENLNICFMLSELGRNIVGVCAAAKGGLKMLSGNMATEWAKHNIQINRISPRYFATSQTAPIRVEGHPFNDSIVGRTPAGSWGDPDDLQGAAIFLSSDASNIVNRQILYIDGGILATIGKPVKSIIKVPCACGRWRLCLHFLPGIHPYNHQPQHRA